MFSSLGYSSAVTNNYFMVRGRRTTHSYSRAPAILWFPNGDGGADPFAIMKAMGHTDMKTTIIYVSLGKSHIREQVEKLNTIHLFPATAPRMTALPAPVPAT